MRVINTIFPNQNNLSQTIHNNADVSEGYNGFINENKIYNLKIGDGGIHFSPTFANSTFPEIMNYYENMVLTSIWDTRENGDFETIVLGRSNHFYKNEKFNWKNPDDDRKYKEQLKESFEGRIEPTEFYSHFYKTGVEDNILSARVERKKRNFEPLTNIIDETFKNNLFEINSRRISENHFAVSKINLINHDITVSKETANTLSLVTEGINKLNEKLNFDTDVHKLSISVIHTNIKSDLIEKPVKDIIQASLQEEISKKNLLVQCDYMATQLVKELEMIYQGKIYILFNDKIQIGDTITLIDESTSTQGIFKILSFEHVLDERGLLTVLTVCANWELREPTLDLFSSKIAYELIKDFKENFFIDDLDSGDNYLINRIYGIYLKYITQSVKYATMRYVAFDEDGELGNTLDLKNDYSNLKFIPSIMPLRLTPMFRKGKLLIPESLDKAFDYSNFIYKSFFNRLLDMAKIKTERIITSFGQGFTKVLNFLGDSMLSLVTFNLHELLKPAFGITTKYAKEAIIGKVNVGYGEKTASSPYSPYSNRGPLGSKYDLTIAFFNTQLQKLDNLNNGKDIQEKEAIDRVNEKSTNVKNLITELFDYTFMTELYDSFKIGNLYTHLDYIRDVTPNNGSGKIISELFKNKYGTEYGVMFTKHITVDEELKDHISINNSNSTIAEENSRRYVKSSIDISNLGLKIKKVHIYWFHNLYGATDMDDNTIIARNSFISNVLLRMNSDREKNPNDGYVLMGDCNMKIYNHYRERNSESQSSDNNNFVYYLSEEVSKHFKSLVKQGTTLKKSGEVNNTFDNIVASNNLLTLGSKFVYGVYEYNYSDKRLLSDHLPIYIGFKKGE